MVLLQYGTSELVHTCASWWFEFMFDIRADNDAIKMVKQKILNVFMYIYLNNFLL